MSHPFDYTDEASWQKLYASIDYEFSNGKDKSSHTADEIEQWVKRKATEYYQDIKAVNRSRNGLYDYLRLHKDPIIKIWFGINGTRSQVDKLWDEIKQETLGNLGKKKDDDDTLKIQTAEQLLARTFPPKDYLLGEYIHTGSRMLMFAGTGVGKTLFALSMAFHISHGEKFLNWKGSNAVHWVLYVDGEMGAEDMQARVKREQKRSGLSGVTLCTLCCEDIEDLRPLNTKEGRDRLMAEIEKIEQALGIKFDLIIFDNVQALLESGTDMWGQSWEACGPWQRSLTKRRTAQIWLHHTGNQQDNAYGTDRMKWQMTDTTLMMAQQAKLPDVAFTYDPQKKRGLTDTNFENFAKFHVKLTPNGWSIKPMSSNKSESITGKSMIALKLLEQAIETDGGKQVR
jgi:hypothetical protein